MKEFVKKKAVIVMDSAGLPNYMTMFYMEPGTYEPEDVPELFKIRNKIVPAVLVSQFTNTMIKGVPASLPYQQPKHTISYDEAAAVCGRKGKGWHLMTNTEFVYLLHEAEELGHTIGGNTNYGSNSKNEQESGVRYDSAGRTLTGCDPLTWSHDGTADGVFGLCGNFWEWVTGLRLHKGVVEYTPNNDAAVDSFLEEYDEFNIEAQFKAAATVSISYALMSRCGLEPERYFTHEDFMAIFDFNTPATIGALGTAVSQINQQVLRQIGVTIRNYEREQLAERSKVLNWKCWMQMKSVWLCCSSSGVRLHLCCAGCMPVSWTVLGRNAPNRLPKPRPSKLRLWLSIQAIRTICPMMWLFRRPCEPMSRSRPRLLSSQKRLWMRCWMNTPFPFR